MGFSLGGRFLKAFLSMTLTRANTGRLAECNSAVTGTAVDSCGLHDHRGGLPLHGAVVPEWAEPVLLQDAFLFAGV